MGRKAKRTRWRKWLLILLPPTVVVVVGLLIGGAVLIDRSGFYFHRYYPKTEKAKIALAEVESLGGRVTVSPGLAKNARTRVNYDDANGKVEEVTLAAKELTVNLSGTNTSDTDIKWILDLPSEDDHCVYLVRSVLLRNTRVSDHGVKELQARFPSAAIVR